MNYLLIEGCFFAQPLDGHGTEAPSEFASLPDQSSVVVNKTRVPCYFYFNGLCSKGDRCSFLHGPDDSAPAGKPSKAAAQTNDALQSENKLSGGNGTGSAPTKTHPNPVLITSKQAVDTSVQTKVGILHSSPRSFPQRSASPPISLSGCEEAAAINSDFTAPLEGFMKTKSHLYTDWSPEEQVDDYIEPEGQRESSPGFDVLVDNDNMSENWSFEDDPEYLLAINREHRELNGHLLGYDFEDAIEYEPMYPDDACNCLDNQHILDDFSEHPSHSKGRILDSILSQKRKLLPMKLAVANRSADLRDYLRKRRLLDGHSVIHSSRRRESSRLIGQSQDRPRGRLVNQQLHRRLASEFGGNYIKSNENKGTFFKRANRQGWPRHSKSNMLRQDYKEKRRASKESDRFVISREPFSGERISSQISSTFTGPKTLAEIKEEKKKAEENGDCFGEMGNSTRMSVDFQGPKPLNEILKEKRRLDTV